MNKRLYPFTFMAFALLLIGCASVGLAPAQSFDDKLAYSYGVHTAVLQAAAASVTNGSLSKADGEAILSLSDKAKALLDSAKAVEATDQQAAGDKLALATSILVQVQTYLNNHAGVKP